jgi:HK97 family phage major capsid protein
MSATLVERRVAEAVRDVELLDRDGTVADRKRAEQELRTSLLLLQAQQTGIRTSTSPYTREAAAAGVSWVRDTFMRHRDPAANERLTQHEEARTVTDSGSFVPIDWVADEWAGVPRHPAAVVSTLRRLPLPDYGDRVQLPQLTTGVLKQTPAQGATIGEQDIASTKLDAYIETVAANVDAARQTVERAAPGLDLVVAADMRRAMGEELERQAINGAGHASRELKGVLNTSGTNSITFTNASPTQTDFLNAVMQGCAAIAKNRRRQATHLLLASRDFAWLCAGGSTSSNAIAQGSIQPTSQPNVYTSMIGPALTIVVSNQVPVNLGGGSNESRAILYVADDAYYAEGDSRSFSFGDVDISGQLSVRMIGMQQAALSWERYPTGIAVISGTGMATKTGFNF